MRNAGTCPSLTNGGAEIFRLTSASLPVHVFGTDTCPCQHFDTILATPVGLRASPRGDENQGPLLPSAWETPPGAAVRADACDGSRSPGWDTSKKLN